jgi:GH24 family phage-related lysozyme (muramidase)
MPSRPIPGFKAKYVPSKKLIAYMLRREGIVLVPYRDNKGWSVLAGHYLGGEGQPHSPPTGLQELTISKALSLMVKDVNERAKLVNKYIKVPIKQEQFDTLVTLFYQGGTDGLYAVCNIINQRDVINHDSVLTSNREVARELLNWDTDNSGKHLEGLLMRRGREVAMFTAGEYGSDIYSIPYWNRVDPETGKVRKEDIQWYDLKIEEIPDE